MSRERTKLLRAAGACLGIAILITSTSRAQQHDGGDAARPDAASSGRADDASGARGRSGVGGGAGASGADIGAIGVGRMPYGPGSVAPRIDVRIRPPAVDGPLDPQIVRRVVQRSVFRARFCFESALLVRQPGVRLPAGTVRFEFIVAPNGRVAMSRILSVSTPAYTPMLPCLENGVRTLFFPAIDGGGPSRVTAQWLFVPSLPPAIRNR